MVTTHKTIEGRFENSSLEIGPKLPAISVGLLSEGV
jgi:hypothetical protein